MSATRIPELGARCNSWVVTSPHGKVFELFDRKNVEKAAKAGWQIETAINYLARIRGEIKK